ncbi:hypothetical protein [Methylocystis hirsuta]|uniref:DNA-binding protein n=1 Tax=Methylocystis hirsuta TaxID=369798 RepID=A0A3M9XTP3_9HYPH|nr:hypothetical protein [Methylocystis hirsuta]RNJ51384.1 hypothetical protein D1O30_19070 [Methylocystis hirsuta]
MDDQPRQVATSLDSDFTLTIDEALERYARAGLPRTPRSVQRYAAQGHLDARLMETPFGVKYLITPASVDKHIAYIQEINDATSRDMSRPFAIDNTSHPSHDNQRQAATTTSDDPRHVAAGGVTADEQQAAATRQPATPATTTSDEPRQVATSDAESRYVARLEGEVDFLRGQVATKDEQIKELTERSRETNVLIGGLQRLFAPMLGSADPHQASSHFQDRPQQ